jgi:hypothetical protein
LHALDLPQWCGSSRRAVPGDSDGLAQNKGLIHRPQMRAMPIRAQFSSSEKERCVGLANTHLARRDAMSMLGLEAASCRLRPFPKRTIRFGEPSSIASGGIRPRNGS